MSWLEKINEACKNAPPEGGSLVLRLVEPGNPGALDAEAVFQSDDGVCELEEEKYPNGGCANIGLGTAASWEVPEGVEVWLDGVKQPPGSRMVRKLGMGAHSLSFRNPVVDQYLSKITYGDKREFTIDGLGTIKWAFYKPLVKCEGFVVATASCICHFGYQPDSLYV